MVFGSGPRAGEAIVKHPSIPLISFTGSTAVGRRIQSVSAPFVKRLSLEVQKTIVQNHNMLTLNNYIIINL